MKLYLLCLCLLGFSVGFSQEKQCIPCKNQNLVEYRDTQLKQENIQNELILQKRYFNNNDTVSLAPFAFKTQTEPEEKYSFFKQVAIEISSDITERFIKNSLDILILGKIQNNDDEYLYREIPAVYP